jgi:hypothetical protein
MFARQPFPVKIMIGQIELENVESLKHGISYLGSILTNDGRCTCEIKCKIAMAKAAFNKKRTHFTSTLDLELRKKLVKCYVWSIVLYGAETWTLRAVDQKHLESSEMWCWRRIEKISCTAHMGSISLWISFAASIFFAHKKLTTPRCSIVVHVFRGAAIL